MCKGNSRFWHSLLWALGTNGLKMSVLAACSIFFLKTIIYIEVQKCHFGINGLRQFWEFYFSKKWLQLIYCQHGSNRLNLNVAYSSQFWPLAFGLLYVQYLTLFFVRRQECSTGGSEDSAYIQDRLVSCWDKIDGICIYVCVCSDDDDYNGQVVTFRVLDSSLHCLHSTLRWPARCPADNDDDVVCVSSRRGGH